MLRTPLAPEVFELIEVGLRRAGLPEGVGTAPLWSRKRVRAGVSRHVWEKRPGQVGLSRAGRANAGSRQMIATMAAST